MESSNVLLSVLPGFLLRGAFDHPAHHRFLAEVLAVDPGAAARRGP